MVVGPLLDPPRLKVGPGGSGRGARGGEEAGDADAVVAVVTVGAGMNHGRKGGRWVDEWVSNQYIYHSLLTEKYSD